MIAGMSVSRHSDVPVYRQIVSQLTLMIEMGLLTDGERLPGSRLLASNLGINRNTVAHAYGELRELGLVEPRGRNGMVVVGGKGARTSSEARNRAREILAAAARECLQLGLSAPEIRDLIGGLAAWEAEKVLAVSFVECNRERAEYFAAELAARLAVPVKPLVLGEFDADAERPDLVLTTFFHLAEVRGRLRGPSTEVVAIVAAPHIRTLVQIAEVPKDRTVGVLYSTNDQAVSIRDSLAQAGVTNVVVLSGTGDAELRGVEAVIVPSELPELARALAAKRVRVIEYGNVLDAASVRMAAEVMRELQLARSLRE
ncbi:putative transcriptional regulator [Cryptosporangium arvum DSM 44712]|uniref:Putative transcriptional regulator n=2 Tax=Cryptosporangium TaxID=65502 RepID=A0A010YM43_9ACTN|nr:putative transcriptional regulator [Cryptosporangium arvum DSM 44712]